MSFNGKVVLITGAASGIGAETARHLAKLDAKLSLVDLNETLLNEVVTEISQTGTSKPLAIVADVTNDANRIINETISHFGQLDVLVNNAGIASDETFNDFDVERFDRIMMTNVRSLIVLTNLAVPHLERTNGNIVNLSSIAAICACEQFFSYNISKACVNQFTKCTSLALASKGIRCNAIVPGIIRTPIYAARGVNESNADEFFEQMKSTYLVDRIGWPSDVAAGIAFLATPSFVNGTLLPVDGGYLLKN